MSQLRFVEANGLRFAYLEEGPGPLVLLLHGFPDTAHTWDHIRPLIAARGYRAVSPFMRGYHPTAIPERDADAETIGRDALALIEALGETSAIVVGHDWGATAAYGVAAIAPERVRQLVIVGIPYPAAIRPTPRLAWGVRHFFAHASPAMTSRRCPRSAVAGRLCGTRRRRTWPTCASASATATASRRRSATTARSASARRPTCAGAAVPTLVFAGQGDPIVTPAHYRGAARFFSSEYEVAELPGGHFMHREHPEIFAERLLGHLK